MGDSQLAKLGQADKVWIFDLDNTLHNASAHIFPVMNQAMTQYMMQALQMEQDEAHHLRRHYWQVYGATLKGLMRHHAIDPHHFLAETHRFEHFESMVIRVKKLKYMLDKMPQRKCIFTNAPRVYALQVLKIMGIEGCFEFVFSVESTKFHAKPSPRGFAMLLKKLNAKAENCIMVEDNLAALMTAKRLGMRTVLIGEKLHKPCFVDCRLNSVLALTHIRL